MHAGIFSSPFLIPMLRRQTVPWNHVLLSLPPHASAESSVIIQKSTAPNENREENKTEEMKK